MLWILALFSIVGLAAASPIDNKLIQTVLNDDVAARNSVLEGQLMDLLESLRQTMITGSNDIPVLDPLVVDYFTVDDNLIPLPGLFVAIRDAEVDKLSTFLVDHLTVQRTTIIPLRYRVELDVHIPVLEVNTEHYELSVPVAAVSIFGSGDAKIDIVEPRITVSGIVRPSFGFLSLYVRIEECEVKFSLKDFQPQINGLLGGDSAVADFINSFLQYFVVDIVKFYEDDITETLSSLVLEMGNEILSDLNLFDLLGS